MKKLFRPLIEIFFSIKAKGQGGDIEGKSGPRDHHVEDQVRKMLKMNLIAMLKIKSLLTYSRSSSFEMLEMKQGSLDIVDLFLHLAGMDV